MKNKAIVGYGTALGLAALGIVNTLFIGGIPREVGFINDGANLSSNGHESRTHGLLVTGPCIEIPDYSEGSGTSDIPPKGIMAMKSLDIKPEKMQDRFYIDTKKHVILHSENNRLLVAIF